MKNDKGSDRSLYETFVTNWLLIMSAWYLMLSYALWCLGLATFALARQQELGLLSSIICQTCSLCNASSIWRKGKRVEVWRTGKWWAFLNLGSTGEGRAAVTNLCTYWCTVGQGKVAVFNVSPHKPGDLAPAPMVPVTAFVIHSEFAHLKETQEFLCSGCLTLEAVLFYSTWCLFWQHI